MGRVLDCGRMWPVFRAVRQAWTRSKSSSKLLRTVFEPFSNGYLREKMGKTWCFSDGQRAVKCVGKWTRKTNGSSRIGWREVLSTAKNAPEGSLSRRDSPKESFGPLEREKKKERTDRRFILSRKWEFAESDKSLPEKQKVIGLVMHRNSPNSHLHRTQRLFIVFLPATSWKRDNR